MTDFAAFALAVLALLGAPGPTNTLLAAAGASVGMRGALHLLAGELAGYLLALGCLMFVVAPLLVGYPAAIEVAKAAAAAYLLFLAVRLWRTGAAPKAAEAARPPVRLGDVFVVTLLNPKAFILAFAVFPPVRELGVLPALAMFMLIVGVTGTAWIALGATVGTSARAHVTERRVARASAIVLAAFAAVFATSATASLLA
ncbi:MAG TPA: LysE family transporter [Bauldia sp.]|nr:LysE family transporter [Bauldia sp.]